MIATLVKGRGFRGALTYDLAPDKGTLRDTNRTGETALELASAFGPIRQLRPNLGNAVLHVSLSAAPGEDLTAAAGLPAGRGPRLRQRMRGVPLRGRRSRGKGALTMNERANDRGSLMVNPPRLGALIRESRDEVGWNVTETSARLGCEGGTLSRLLNGTAGVSANMALEAIGWGTAEHGMRLQTSDALARARRNRAVAQRRAKHAGSGSDGGSERKTNGGG